jgi:hypothetical protein
MESNFKLLVFILIGLLLLWFGYKLYLRFFKKKSIMNGERLIKIGKESESPNGASGSGSTPSVAPTQPKPLYKGTSSSGGLMICPICLFRMENGDMIKTRAFPPMPGEKDRLMHIHGCVYCMDGKRERLCPVCGKKISVNDFLVARIFDRAQRRSHVHVLGCTQCRPLKTM